MPNESSRFAVNDFILDCSEVSLRLESIGPRDDRVAMVSALERGRIDYQMLLRRLHLLPMTIADAPLVQVMLDGLLARLNCLERKS
jgi:hypothetical protein